MEKIAMAENYSKTYPDISESSFPVAAPLPLGYSAEFIENPLPLSITANAVIKRIFDIGMSTLLSVCILTWLIPILALIIKLDSRGPVFFLQKRNRNRGRLFTCIKFRTMIVNDQADTMIAGENDNRITKVGRFLRKYHIDELPQLLNVLAGDMSLVGPRPHMVYENNLYLGMLENYDQRHMVRPGITGLAQSLGNFGSTNDLERVRERVNLDISYINNWSFGMDLKILFRTAMIMKSKSSTTAA